MKKTRAMRPLRPKDFHCVYCLLIHEEWNDATEMVWDEKEQKAIPVCDECKAWLEEQEQFFLVFSIN